jgi:hypothetical protein
MLARPKRRDCDEDAQGIPTCIAKLKMSIGRNGRGNAGPEIHRLLVIFVFAPQLPVALKTIPNLLYSLMADGARNGLRRKCTLAQATTFHTWQQSDLGTVRADIIALRRNGFSFWYQMSGFLPR